MDKIVNPEMLILARESRGLSQQELAESIGVTQGKISKYENGMLLVSESDFERLTDILGYTSDFFLQRDKIYGLGSSFLFHRQRKDVPMVLQKKVQAQVNILRMQVDRLLRGAEIESEYSFEPIDIDCHDGDAAKIATLVKAAWKLPLGPVGNVVAAVEAAGGIVLHCSFETRLIDAAHLWLPGLPPLFFLNRDLPGDRQRWTLSHEIGHAIMHRVPSGDVESQANEFASEFLMPRDDIAKHLADITIERAAVLKSHWKVSMAALIKRAWDLNCITERKYRSLFTNLSALGYRTNEPFPIPAEEPTVLRQIVAIHRDELGYDDFDLSKLLFSPDPQFFYPQKTCPAILRFNGQPFFAFITPRTKEKQLGT